MSQLTGKIYWVCDDFAYNGNYFPKNDETVHTVSKVKFAIIQDHMVKFQTEPVDYSGEAFAYNVNLQINERGSHFNGSFSEVRDGDLNGIVSCELFENNKAYFLYGKWIEDEAYYSWWARIDKAK